MPDEPIVILGDSGGRIRSFVQALDRLPAEPTWAVVGSLAANARIAQTDRVTYDQDAVGRDQPALLEILTTEQEFARLAGSELQTELAGKRVDFDVMVDRADAPPPSEASEWAFALARRLAIDTCEQAELQVIERGEPVAAASVPIATVPALIALKTAAMPRRPRGRSPHKVGADICDLVRLAQCCDIASFRIAMARADEDLRRWVCTMLVKWFSRDRDLRCTFARMCQLDGSADAQALRLADLASVAEFGRSLL